MYVLAGVERVLVVTIGERDWPRSRFDVYMGDKLYRARRNARMTQEEVALELGVKPDTVSKWERGLRRPGLQTLRKAVRLFGLDGGFFLGYNPD